MREVVDVQKYIISPFTKIPYIKFLLIFLKLFISMIISTVVKYGNLKKHSEPCKKESNQYTFLINLVIKLHR